MVNDRRAAAIIQARMGSSRLPGKVMMDMSGKSLLGRVIDRVKLARSLDDIVVATSTDPINDIICSESKKYGVKVFRGSEENVLLRYCEAARAFDAFYVVRVTADNPMTEPRFIDICLDEIKRTGADYAAMRDVPYGSNVEAVTRAALEDSLTKADAVEREHVTLYIRNHNDTYRTKYVDPPEVLKRPEIRVTVDEKDDHEMMCRVFERIEAGGLVLSLEHVIKEMDMLGGKK